MDFEHYLTIFVYNAQLKLQVVKPVIYQMENVGYVKHKWVLHILVIILILQIIINVKVVILECLNVLDVMEYTAKYSKYLR